MLSRASWAALGLIVFLPGAALAANELPAPAAAEAPASAAESAPPSKKKHKKKRKKKGPAATGSHGSKRRKARSVEAKPSSGFSLRSFAGVGFQHGYTVRHFDSLSVKLRVAWAPWRVLGPVRIELPIEYQQLNLPGSSLNEFAGSTTLRATLHAPHGLQPFASAELNAVWRPNWPDLYQPRVDGGLSSTDRFSYWQRRYQVGVQALVARGSKAKLSYAYSLWDYRTDPAFRPVQSPNHLTPSDHEEHALQASLVSTFGALRPRFTLDLFQRNYFFVFARDRQTGRTHAGPGGLPPNPLYATQGAEPELSVAARLRRWSLRGSIGVQIVHDTFQGYYSSVAEHPSLSVRWLPSKKWSIELGGELWLRRYGPDSYGAGPSHPALTFGDRRVDRRGSVQVESRFRLADNWTLAGTAEATLRRSNFPAYEPGIFPRNARYSIDWNYDNWLLMLALEYRLRPVEPAD